MSGRGSVRRYSGYKDSGVEWVGDVPAHWEVTRTKFVARLRSGHTPSRQNPEYWVDCTIPWFGLADVWQIRDGRREYVTETSEKISQVGLDNSSARLLPAGTVILSRTASVGFSAILGVDMATTQDFVNWVPGERIRSEYLLYVFRAMEPEFRRLTMGSTHQTIYMPDVGRFMTPLPPLEEQDRIIRFLRDRVSRIDTLIENYERLGQLLEAKRAALIGRAANAEPNGPKVRLKQIMQQVVRPIRVHPDFEYQEIGLRSWGRGIFHKERIRGRFLEEKSVFWVEPGDFVLNIVFAWEGAAVLSANQSAG